MSNANGSTPPDPSQPNGSTPPAPEIPRTMFVCAYLPESGEAKFNFSGSKPNLIELMGLWVHAGFSMFDLWRQTFGKKDEEQDPNKPRIFTPGGR